eukprot:365961-Chlamydomonas_euryale.AAC.1
MHGLNTPAASMHLLPRHPPPTLPDCPRKRPPSRASWKLTPRWPPLAVRPVAALTCRIGG